MVFRKLFGKKEEEKPKAIGISRGARRTNLFLKIILIEKVSNLSFRNDIVIQIGQKSL